MATRYSGELTIRLTYRDESGDYHCTVSRAGVHVGSVDVGSPALLQYAVDSPHAYDCAAHAALSFLSDEGTHPYDVASYAAVNAEGWLIGRKPHVVVS